MKGFTKDGKFRPIKPYSKVRKSRDQSTKSKGVRLQREDPYMDQKMKWKQMLKDHRDGKISGIDVLQYYYSVPMRNLKLYGLPAKAPKLKSSESYVRKEREVHSDYVRDPNLPSVSGKGRLKCRHCGRLTADDFADLGCDCQLPDNIDQKKVDRLVDLWRRAENALAEQDDHTALDLKGTFEEEYEAMELTPEEEQEVKEEIENFGG